MEKEPYQRKDDRWACAVSMGRDPITGKVIRKIFYGKTQEEVKKAPSAPK